MAEVTITIRGRQYGIACDEGQEQRVLDLGNYIDERLNEIASAGAGTNESHLLVLTSLVIADELFDLHDSAANNNRGDLGKLEITDRDEGAIIEAIDQMATRIDSIAGRLQKL